MALSESFTCYFRYLYRKQWLDYINITLVLKLILVERLKLLLLFFIFYFLLFFIILFFYIIIVIIIINQNTIKTFAG